MTNKDNDQFRVETFANAMSKRHRVHISIPRSGQINLRGLCATLTKLSDDEVRTLEDAKLWANNADAATHPNTKPPYPGDPLSEVGFRFEVMRRLEAVEELREKVRDAGEAEAPLDELISQSMGLGRAIERARTQQKFLPHVEVGKKVKEGGRTGGDMRLGQRAPSTQERLDRMASFLKDGATESEAARKLFAETKKWSVASNYKLLQRNRE